MLSAASGSGQIVCDVSWVSHLLYGLLEGVCLPSLTPWGLAGPGTEEGAFTVQCQLNQLSSQSGGDYAVES